MRTKHAADHDELLSVGEAAELLAVHPDTLKRWERAGRIEALRTPTGHRRFRRRDVEHLLARSAS
ncbi:MAG: helix-turn-helix domain-containing protein [Cellulomonas sp.]|uniref:MerR family transcriptional regulator n=1 Tax=Cellulomonas sp. 73-92 TaxID=1895740 RepID=UPI000927DB3A|nr:helix-turn-helix domain-containing protein [Cellulomonas sp. 73-92]MBN9374602.1 helix-turn-helix domain-containing protein [Cellulomonas sp.]OJV76478.1 MAG: hypothetical protein BGO37_10490 [Cellulomonas sp. 73-92]